MTEIENQKRTTELMTMMAAKIDEYLKIASGGKKSGFILLVFDPSKPGPSNFISSVDPESMIKSLKETAESAERDIERGDITPKMICPIPKKEKTK